MKVIFRTDASLKIGTGHVMRCLTLAKVLRKRSCDCRFICRKHSGNLVERIRQEGFETITLPFESDLYANKNTEQPLTAHADWLGCDWQTDALQTINLLAGETTEWLIVDHYTLDSRWESLLRPHAKKIMVIDDLADRDHNCDLLLDQNLVANLEHRYDGLLPTDCAQLLGPHYAMLQPEYAELHPRTPPRLGPIERILIYFGGSDQHNLTGLVLSAFLALNRNDIALDIVISRQGPYIAKIRKQAEGHPHITLHDSLPSLAPLILKADLAIGAAGATSWERCCLGLPTLVITFADNQKPIADTLNQQRLVRWLGHYNKITESAFTKTLQEVLNTSELEHWSRSCMTIVDGKGVEHVAAAITLDANTALKSRLARLNDEALLIRWSNDHIVLQNSFNSDQISKETHRKWFYARLRNPKRCRIYIVETDEGLPVGQVGFERHDAKWEIHFGLSTIARGRKLGRRILESAIYEFHFSKPDTVLKGWVKQENLNSQWVFEEFGFTTKVNGEINLSVAVCSDSKSWINNHIPKLIIQWLSGRWMCWTHNADILPGGTLCFYLSYGRIVNRELRAKYRYNLVVHASNLPKGRGWSPASWMILEGKKRIPVTLLEASDDVDSAEVYAPNMGRA